MSYSAKFRLGDMQIEVNADTAKTLFERLTLFGEIPKTCGKCEGTNLWPRHRIAQNRYHYYEMVCRACGHRCKLGQTQEGGHLFCRGEWEPPYQGEDDRHEEPPRSYDPSREDREDLDRRFPREEGRPGGHYHGQGGRR